EIGENETRFAADVLGRGTRRLPRGFELRHFRRADGPWHREGGAAEDEPEDEGTGAAPESLNAHNHSTSLRTHKTRDYKRTLGGSAMPPVRKMRMPSSTVMSGNSARARSTTMTAPR